MFVRIFLIVNFVCIGLIGLAYLYDPNLLLSQYGLETGSIGIDNMLRSTYGGVFLSVSLIFLIGVLNNKRRQDALFVAALFMGGLAIGRLTSIALVGTPPTAMMLLLYYECAAVLIAFVLYSRSTQTA